ncbi:unnamed protein product [Cylicocyclus nassatus]|uniref:Uncharacterized protein n=1 Tax=Cylicocyclus nassatus TaxID=53992 RepID=A0AA36H9H9_CYLNA|nr:unnamed protein product [Cylicocyclus nassatus]
MLEEAIPSAAYISFICCEGAMLQTYGRGLRMGEKATDADNESIGNEVRQILILPPAETKIHETAHEELRSLVEFLNVRLDEYKEFLHHNSAAVFAVNYIQNRYVSAEFCAEIAKLFEMLNVKTEAEYEKALEAMQSEPETETDVIAYRNYVGNWNELIEDIDKKLDEKLGPCSNKVEDDGELPELGVELKTLSHYVTNSAFNLVLVVVVSSFNSAEVNQRIMALYNKMSEFHSLGCDVYLLTKGPPIGSRGGSYIKLVGVPFRKLYDEQEALNELKTQRRSATQLAGWSALLRMVEKTLADDLNLSDEKKISETSAEQTSFVTHKGGAILVNRSGTILYKYVEDEGTQWPSVEDIVDEVKKAGTKNTSKTPSPTPNKTKVDSEVSAKNTDEEKKKCCTIL